MADGTLYCFNLNLSMQFRVESRSPVAFNTLSANPTKWSKTLKQFINSLPTNCLSVFDHFVKLAFKRLRRSSM